MTSFAIAGWAEEDGTWGSVDNEDDVEVAGNEVATLWYYFGSPGKAYKTDASNLNVKEIGADKLKYAFNDEGHMASG